MKDQPGKIRVINAFENNLKNISVEIPHNAMTVITGVSGSGKSSLAYNVIFRESQRRFLESFSSYSRQYLGKLEKPKVQEITGLQPALAINQKTVVANPRSTVGTMSGVYDYLRLLYARVGKTDDPVHDADHPAILAKLFSFNSAYGACPSCKGLGVTEHIDKQKLISNPDLTLRQGALVPTTPNGYIVYSQVRVDELDKVCHEYGFSVDIPWKELTSEQQDVIWYGSEKVKILFGKHSLESRLKWKGITARPREEGYYKGMIPIMEDILQRDRNDNILRFASAFPCSDCGGARLNRQALSVLIDGRNIAELSGMQLSDLHLYIKQLNDLFIDNEVVKHILHHILKRLEYLQLLGLGYLAPDRESTTISGGEAQRIRLASQVGTGLRGILYVLDEPSVGLHPRDNNRMLDVLRSLRDNGNTLLVVEHDENTIRSADYLIDIGPKAGNAGGELIFQGKSDELLQNAGRYPDSLTARTISGELNDHPGKKRLSKGIISIKGASKFNLKNIDVEFNMGVFNVVTGVSGAGKSTLVHKVLGNYLRTTINDGSFDSIESTIPISRIMEIDQSPIGRTPRSNPATYTDLFDHIRILFASRPGAIERQFDKGRFSFNNEGGRCEKCQGAGYMELGMHFVGDVEIICDECNGKRFNDDTLRVTFNGKNIYDVLEMSVLEAREFFDTQPKITRILDQLIALDVGYLKLGQPSTTLSGGEAQRIKLASELYKMAKGHGLYILDEPSTGLHKADIQKLLEALNKIVDDGNTVIVIEHDTDIIRQADHIIDLGPEGGEKGGNLIVAGSLEEIINCRESFTGKSIGSAGVKKTGPTDSPVGAPKKVNTENIRLFGISTNNLKHIDAEFPLNKTTVVTGISGSGKSSLVFDTLYSESRNRFTESFSSYARRMMDKVKRPDLEQCSGLTPAIAVRQDRFGKNPRSTVGTVTEIFDLYRLLFSRAGRNLEGHRTSLPASMFSFNNPEAACPACKGPGLTTSADPEKFVTHPGKPLIDGAMDGTPPGRFFGERDGQYVNTLLKVGEVHGIVFSVAFNELSDNALQIALFGTGLQKYDVEWKFKRGERTGVHKMTTTWKGFVGYLDEDYEIKKQGSRGEAFRSIMSEKPCKVCHGKRFRPEVLEVTFDGMDISRLSAKSIKQARVYFSEINKKLDPEDIAICDQIVFQVIQKLKTLEDLGLGYLSIDRKTETLSGGEAQRLKIASQLVSGLCGLTYVFDEPTIGLHPRDTLNLMRIISTLKANGNTVVMVEHDPEVITMADHIIEMGPGAGANGGTIIARGGVEDILQNPASVTGRYLSRIEDAGTSKKRELKPGISVRGARANNLKSICLDIPAGGIITVAGVSGSGKTSLVFDVIADSYNAGRAVNCDEISFHNIDSMMVMDQDTIGTSPMSTPATYTGLFDYIRDLFAGQKEAKSSGLGRSHFSFNSSEGRCPVCKGMGSIKSSLDFLSEIWVTCDVCHGRRFKDIILGVKFKSLNIYEVLDLEVDEALLFFGKATALSRILQVLSDIGLGYLKLGQATSTLSGGETQRLKLAYGLIGKSLGKCLYIFDEPTTGLHMQDVEKLLVVLNKLADEGNTVLVIEHNHQIIKASDRVIELGPEGGDEGGYIMLTGK
jgi:excinuclease ABC subunit A